MGDIPSVSGLPENFSKEIFINTHVTPFVGRLLHRGRIAVKEKKLVACWMSANSVLIKATNESDPVMIKSMSDFDKIWGVVDLPISEPNAVATGKRRMNDSSPTIATDLQPKSKPRTQMRGKNSTGPLSSKVIKEKATAKTKNN